MGKPQPLPIPDRPWRVIGIDFVVKLLLSSGFDSILVIMDHFTKGAHIIPCRERMTAANLTVVFVQHFFCLNGLPDKIVSDWGPSSVSAFWLAVQRALHIKSATFTAYRPETDGQTEWTNQTIETYLHHFVSHRQDDWADWIPIAEFCFNNSTSSSTKPSPFFACQGFHPRANSFTAPSKVPRSDESVSLLEDTQVQLIDALCHAKSVQAAYDVHVRETIPFLWGLWSGCHGRTYPSLVHCQN